MSLPNFIIIIVNFLKNKFIFFSGLRNYYLDIILKKKYKKNFFKKINNYIEKNNKRILTLKSNAFGFSLMQIDYAFKYIKYFDLNKDDIIFISPKIKNSFLKKILHKKLKVNLVEYKNIFYLLTSLFPKKKYFNKNYIICPADCGNYDYSTNLKITFTEEEKKLGDLLLNDLGISHNDKFAIISYKSDRYSELFSEKVKNYTEHSISQKYRTSCFKNLSKTLSYLEDNNIKPLIFNYLNEEEEKFFLNYAKINDLKNTHKRDFLEFYSHYRSDFSICGNSGDQFIPKLFNKKTLFHNGIIPHSISDGVFLPKKFYDKSSGKMLDLKKVLSRKILYYEKSDISKIMPLSPIYFRDIRHFEKKNIDIAENNEDEILNATKEIIILSKNHILNLDHNQTIQQNKIKEIYHGNFYNTENTLIKKKIGGYISPSFLDANKDFFH